MSFLHSHPVLRSAFVALCSAGYAAGLLFGGSAPARTLPPSVYDIWHAGMETDSAEPYSVSIPDLDPAEAAILREAERGPMPKGASFSHERAGFSGTGYIEHLPAETESAVTYTLDVPHTQHYSVTFCFGTDVPVACAWRLNGELQQEFTVEASENFTRITFYGIFIEKGKAQLSLDTLSGSPEIDYIELNDDSSLYHAKSDPDSAPCDPDASPETRRLYRFLRENWGKHILTGQYVSDSKNRELDTIYQLTGQLPAIRFGAFGTGEDLAAAETAIDWSLYMKGIVGMMWHWNAPNSDSVYAKEVSFNLRKAVCGLDAEKTALLSAEEIAAKDTLPAETKAILADIDHTAEYLEILCNMDIPVLWRPLHEASGGWYWWGAAGEEAYCQLWKLLYYRLSAYHGLHNLIWIWNGQSAEYQVPPDLYDIASADVYLSPQTPYGSRYEQFLSLQRITRGRKMLALSECSSLPSLSRMELDRSLWSFYGTWYGQYLMNPDGSFCDRYYTSNDLCNMYNCELSLTLKGFLAEYQ